jgi:isoleucyl-tRNA synthetase
MENRMPNIDKKIDQLEEATQKYASKDTVISIGGYEFTPAKLMIAFTLVSSILGGLYGAFEVYKDYMSMKEAISSYVAPDLSEFDKRLAVIEENSSKTSDYTRDIKNDLKNDIRRNESITEQIERNVKLSQRETEQEMREMRKAVREDLERARTEAAVIRKDVEQTRKEINSEFTSARREITKEVEQLKKEVDSRIQKAIDNPLANR